jgi:hypothetical protein
MKEVYNETVGKPIWRNAYTAGKRIIDEICMLLI